MLLEFHFLRPEWLWALPLVLFLCIALARRQLAPGGWQHVVSPQLMPYVLSRRAVRGTAYRWWLLAIGGILAVLALAGPSWQRIEQPVFRSAQALVIALDLSRSMDAQDVSPSRLARARLKILDILEQRQSGQTALLVFSSNAFTVTPLTSDTDTVAALVNSLSTDIMPSRGSYLVAAIEKGRQLLQQAGVGYGEVLIISDGGSTPAAESAAASLLADGYTLSVLGVGSESGAPIPRAGGGFVTDRSGNIAVPRLAAAQLQRLAAAGGGRFAPLSNDNRDIESLLSGEVGSAGGGSQPLSTDQWQEEGPWLLLLLVPLAALAFRRGLVFALLLCAGLPPDVANAFDWDDLWLNANQQGQEKLAQGAPGEAAGLFNDPAWQAVANYRAGRYPESAAAFAEGGDAESLYNLGNSLAKMGKFESAIDAYEESLAMRPDDEDTIYNRDLVARLLQQQQQQQQDQQESSEQSESGGDSQQSSSDSDAEQQGQESADGDESGEMRDGDSERSDAESSQEDLDALQQELERAAREAEEQSGEDRPPEMTAAQAEAMRRAQEQTQAMEQWLRRIENDPGGLLRRKFRYQYQKQGRDQDGNSVWPDDDVEPW